MRRETQRWVIVARILRPRGNKGEVLAELLTDFPERLAKLREVYLAKNNDTGAPEPHLAALKSFWLDKNHPGQGIFHFEGYETISQAETLRGSEILIPFEQRVALPVGKYFVTDLIGCSVFELPRTSSGMASSPCSLEEVPLLLGTVRDVQFTGDAVAGTPLLVVETARGEVLIPLADEICTSINTAARRIDVVLQEGLRELNPEE